MSKINYHETDTFKKCFKKIVKKFKTLPQDLETAKRNAIDLFHDQHIDNQSVVLIPGYGSQNYQIYKLRKFACRSLKGKGVMSGIRIIYAYDPVSCEVHFIEIYFKADQVNEDGGKIETFLSGYSEEY